MTVGTNWVEQNFKASIIGTVQRVAYETKEELEFTTADVPRSAKHGYINVETEGITCSPLDKRIINRLKFVCQRSVKTGPIYKEIGGKRI